MTTHNQPTKTKKRPSNGLPDVIGGIAIPKFLQKIPLPILGGGVALVGMVAYVLIVALTAPLPDAPPPVASPAPTSAPVSSAPPQEKGTTAATTINTAVSSTRAPSASQEEPSLIPAYQGPQSDDMATKEASLPTISRAAAGLPDLGRRVLMTQDDFFAQTREEGAPSGGDPLLAYRLRLPTRFTALEGGKGAVSAQNISGILTEYVSAANADIRSHVRIQAEKMLYAMPLVDWVRKYAFDHRLTIQAMTIYGTDRVEMIYITTEAETSFVVRMAIVQNGPQLIMADYAVPMDRYEQEKDIQTWVIASFHSVLRTSALPEETQSLKFYDLVQFDYFKSWTAQNQNISNVQTMNVSLVNTRPAALVMGAEKQSDILQGRIDVFVFSRLLEQGTFVLDDYMHKWFDLQQLQLSAPIGQFDAPHNDHGLGVDQARVQNLSNLQGRYQNYHYFSVRLEGKNYLYFVGLMTPPQVENPANWARNQMAFDQVVRSLREGN